MLILVKELDPLYWIMLSATLQCTDDYLSVHPLILANVIAVTLTMLVLYAVGLREWKVESVFLLQECLILCTQQQSFLLGGNRATHKNKTDIHRLESSARVDITVQQFQS